MRRPWVGGNWKMHGSLAENKDLLLAVKAGVLNFASVDVAVAPPAPYWLQVAEILKDSALEVLAQAVSAHAKGAYTGDYSVAMLADCGLAGALVGHSERRQGAGETDALVAAQCAALMQAAKQAIVCVGETLAEREAGETLAVVRRQLQAVIDAVGVSAFSQAVVAYEPVWAIGTGLTASPEQAQEVHAALRVLVSEQDVVLAQQLRIVYGGSVKADNAAGLFAMPDIDGALVGGASLQASEFIAICQAAAQRH